MARDGSNRWNRVRVDAMRPGSRGIGARPDSANSHCKVARGSSIVIAPQPPWMSVPSPGPHRWRSMFHKVQGQPGPEVPAKRELKWSTAPWLDRSLFGVCVENPSLRLFQLLRYSFGIRK
jgi:hypothetical protein